MGGQTSKYYGTISEPDTLWKTAWKRLSEQNGSYEPLLLLRFRVYAPMDDSLKASARFEVQKIDEEILKNLKKQFIDNNWEGERVVLECRDGTVSPHKVILKSAWSGFLDGKSSLRIDFQEYRTRDIKSMIWFIYSNVLPPEREELLNLLTVAHRLGYKALAQAGSKEITDRCSQLDRETVHGLIDHARNHELKYLYDRLCVVLARNFQRKEFMLSLDSDILKDVLSQDCLAVFSEDDVRQFIEDYVGDGEVPLIFARPLRYKFLKQPLPEKFALNEFFKDHHSKPRDSSRPYFVRARAKVKDKGRTLTMKIKIELTMPDGKIKKLCAFKQHSNVLREIKTNFEFPVAIVSCGLQYFVQLGKSVIQIDPFRHSCYVVCHDVVKLTANESCTEVLTKFNQRIVLFEGPSKMEAFCDRQATDVIDPTFAIDFGLELPKGSDESASLE